MRENSVAIAKNRVEQQIFCYYLKISYLSFFEKYKMSIQEEEMRARRKAMSNPIGWLQEMCVSRRWPLPRYEIVNVEGLQHIPKFTIACEVSKYREVGTGQSKNLAKRQAALKVVQYFQELLMEENNLPQGLDDDDEISQKVTNIAAYYADLKGSKISPLPATGARKIFSFYKNLKQSSGPKLSELQKTCLNNKDFNYVQFLEEIASEQEFEITYLRIKEKSIVGEYQYLVKLSELPIAVCRGSGMTSGDARANAAQTALEYLKILTKK